MKPTIIEDEIFEFEPFEKDGSELMAAETSWRGMAEELQELHYLKGARFINQLKLIIYYGEFHLVEGETNILSAISGQSDESMAIVSIYCLIRKELGQQISFSNEKVFIKCLTLKPLLARILLTIVCQNL